MKSKGVILLFVEWDNFEKRLATSPLRDQFSDFDGDNDPHKAFNHIRDLFLNLNKRQAHRVYTRICNNDNGTILEYIVGKTQEISMKQSLKSNSRTLPK